ncbi:MAPEG family protein [Methyloligella sp. 2.7D]|uniref:MAPEG family protein n=1 Tax=unclassified Methyloligella TaxID=2625955 RepID=UPI00157D0E91|nr:MAPEG family protein [Methyloligella sp. GL2]QKP77710.1 MAPEG family protein [Methyloligella sp. GL2]
MQRNVQTHSAPSRTKRRRKRPDPRKKHFGFTSHQWPFLLVLVSNWLFALVFLIICKLVWHWVPAEWNTMGDRIALVIKDSVFAILPGVIAICIVAAERLDPKMFVGRMAKPNSALDINTRFILNTFEQFTAYFIAHCALAIYSPPEEARTVVILTALFVLGRILFWIGYHKNPYLRAFGFGITFYPTVAAYFCLVVYMTTGIRVPL